ncbi:Erg28-like protein [Choiromyces venosus 120613-1]|uniref:Erg28-like protein n=1 Tax=Choiromyces venosus 120613-1 TaxID=1336337 RepID=A0A3N4IS54_9PEZI|nr:Erg28-like protein [Choiromyces venosus 120613-1]RPA92939.1 Erg28-like protein [Choiromyces venosus 120613-1]
METLTTYLPQTPGLLPKWLLFVAVVALGNSFQAYSTLRFNKRIYCKRPHEVTGLSSRTFGTWTVLSAILRAYAAYHITEPVVYDLAMWSYAVAGAHFVSEWLVFGSAGLVFTFLWKGGGRG